MLSITYWTLRDGLLETYTRRDVDSQHFGCIHALFHIFQVFNRISRVDRQVKESNSRHAFEYREEMVEHMVVELALGKNLLCQSMLPQSSRTDSHSIF